MRTNRSRAALVAIVGAAGVAAGAAFALAGGDTPARSGVAATPVAVRVVQAAAAGPPRSDVAAPAGTLRILGSDRVDPATLTFLGTSARQHFFAGRGVDPSQECLVVSLSPTEGYTSCGRRDAPLREPNIMWSDRREGSHAVSVQLPPGYTAATVDGREVGVSNGVFGFDATAGAGALTIAARGDGVAPLSREVDVGGG